MSTLGHLNASYSLHQERLLSSAPWMRGRNQHLQRKIASMYPRGRAYHAIALKEFLSRAA